MSLLGTVLGIIMFFALSCMIVAIICSFLSAWGSKEM